MPERTRNAGRITPEMGLTAAEWQMFADGANKVARAVLSETGLRTVFHHHCAGYVETPDEIAAFPGRDRSGSDRTCIRHWALCVRRGPVRRSGCARAFQKRVWYIHLKDCHPEVARRARAEGWDYFEALRHGVFCELGKGGVDFPGVLRWLKDHNYDGYTLVEQDVLPGMGAPKESARRNREYLRAIEGGGL